MERAVNYCRCSTEEESQRDALKIQVAESREMIRKMGWIHVDEYVEAKSGTRVKGRTQYQRLLEDMLEDKFDIIVIKDQDRLMRNTKDWYLFLDRMLQNKKRLYMYLEGKYYTPDDALITGIRAILAEEYSRTLSKKINHAHRNRQEKGSNVILNSRTFGFTKVGRQPAEINEKEAAAVRRIYDLSIEGYGASRIVRQLYIEGYTDRQGKPLQEARVRRIIRNPLYKGVAIMNKRHFDFETKQEIKNPKEELIVHEGMIPAIVSSEKWDLANQAMDARLESQYWPDAAGLRRHRLSHKIICGVCGETYYRTTRKNRSGRVYEWKCSSYLRYGKKRSDQPEKEKMFAKQFGCDNVSLEEEILMQKLEEVRISYYEEKEGSQAVINQILAVLEGTLGDRQEDHTDSIQKQIRKIEHQADVLLDKLVNEVITDEDFSRKKQELDQQRVKLQKRLLEQKQVIANERTQEERLQKIRQWLESGGMKKATTMEMMEDISGIIVYPEELLIEFLPGRLKDLEQIQKDPIVLSVQYPYKYTTERGRLRVEMEILHILRENPETTVKKLAELLQIPYHATLNRVNALKQKGKLQYEGKGGRGIWKVQDM